MPTPILERHTVDAPESDLGTDEKILLGLNDDYIHSDQNSDVARYNEFLADDFTASLPDLVFRNRQEFLDLIAQPRPFTGLTLLNVKVRILGDVALLQGRVRYTTKHDGQEREALYTDTYQRRGHRWMCVAGEVVAQGELARDRPPARVPAAAGPGKQDLSVFWCPRPPPWQETGTSLDK
jgi:ketosteroid isomerase-like protein